MEFSEKELTSMICDNNEDVKDAIFDKYSYLWWWKKLSGNTWIQDKEDFQWWT